ncbi:polysaccharide deacetylase family protein [Pectinatus sottacetonis]|uniref:polysaccharide deacetylase family protein n=1 Tax=Pectinatus sottacetonis TaxID=1002795 RepID=UPI0018C4A63A|nr:polysaccharide deacetylase family protein [Pectinatus sottacetonis]
MFGRKTFVAALILVMVGICGYWYFYSGHSKQYSDVTDLSGEYTVDSEMQDAQNKLNKNIKPADIYTRTSARNAIALTIDGSMDPVTTDRILDLLNKYNITAVFFIDGSTAAKNDDFVKKIYKRGFPIENYTYVGLAHLDKMPQEEILLQLLKTQKVIQVITGKKPEIFKAPRTKYTLDLLKLAAASGLKAAVESSVYIKPDEIKTDEDADNFISKVKMGSIISLPVDIPVDQVKYEPGKTDDKPAFDKKPGLKIDIDKKIEHENIVDVLERILKAIKAKNIKVIPLTEFPLKITNQQNNKILSYNLSGFNKIAALADHFLFTRAYAASRNYELLRKENAGKEAHTTKLILTTEPSVCFAFAGLTKPKIVYDILDRLQNMHASGTFFVMKNDIDKNPQLIRDIIKSGNEVGIGIRSLKDANFYTTCTEIDYVRTKLRAMGADPRLAMQPWGQITADTREAVSAEQLDLIGPYINVVNSNMKNYTSAQKVMDNTFGKFVYSLGRGWIVYFRLDYYNDDNLVGKVMDLVKRYKIDNTAYNSFYDDPKINHNNDSQYNVKSVGAVLYNKKFRYNFAVRDEIPENRRDTYNPLEKNHVTFKDYIKKRYIGNPAVGMDSNALGFSIAGLRNFDMTGRIHTTRPVVFFTFDDWGMDASINRLLYVLRKHNVKATFFVLTHNVLNNPNLLRTIAEQGNDIGAHSDMHKPMTTQDVKTNVLEPSVQSRAEYMKDLSSCYKKLEMVTGDVEVNRHPALTRYFRPPTLTVSKMGFECLYDNGYTYIVNGSYSTHDYDQTNLESMINAIKKGIFDRNGQVRKGAVLVMHMSDSGQYTAVALDMILTANEQRKDNDPAKFFPARLSDYLKDGYDQSRPKQDENMAENKDYGRYLYKNSGYGMEGE